MAAGIPGAAPFGGHAGPAFCVAFSPDGRLLATGGGDGNVRLTDLGTETQIAQFTGHADGVKAVAWSPDGTRIASAGADGTTRLWEAASGAEVARLTGHSNQVNAVAWSPDGTRVASGAGTVRLWDAVSGAQVGQLRGHSLPVNAVAWSPDGTRVASGAGTVRLWDAVSGAQVGRLRGHSNPVHAVAWSPDGTRLASGGNSVRLWAELNGGAGKAPEVVTPIDYLDKIFQVPYVLTPPHPEATAAYLRSLLPAAQNALAPRGLARPARPGQAPATVVGGDVATSPDLTVVPRETDSQLPADPAPAADEREASRAGGAPTAAGRRELPSGRPAGQEPPTARDRDPRRIGMPGADSDLARAATTDLQPQGLQVSPAEAEFLARLAGLLPTPRAAKRLVNLYRLTRIGIPTAELGEFVGDQDGGPYQSVQVLLAILVGYPELAARLFREVMSGRHEASDLIAVLEEAVNSGDREAGAVAEVIASLRGAAPQALSLDLARQWCPRLARFSFYTRDLALQQRMETRPG